MNQSLIDDGLVDKDKIGGSNYFWSFPAKRDRLAQLQHERLLLDISQLQTTVQSVEAALQAAKRGREEEEEDDEAVTETNTAAPASLLKEGNENENSSKDGIAAGGMTATTTTSKSMSSRSRKLQRLDEITRQRTAVLAELDALKENDPQAIADLEHELKLVTQGANRWTDNVFQCQSYMVKKRGMDKKEAMKLLGIPASFTCTYNKWLYTYGLWWYGISIRGSQCLVGWHTITLSLTVFSLMDSSLPLADPDDKIPK